MKESLFSSDVPLEDNGKVAERNLPEKTEIRDLYFNGK